MIIQNGQRNTVFKFVQHHGQGHVEAEGNLDINHVVLEVIMK